MNRHERRKRGKTKAPVKANTTSARIPTEKFGPSGIAGRLSVLALIPGEMRQDLDRLTDTSLRTIKIRATLSKAAALNEEFNFSIGPDDGSSYMLLPANQVTLKIATNDGAFFIKRNKSNELSYIEAEIPTMSIDDASKKFRRMVTPMLDHLSYLNNCPIFVGKIIYSDEKNNNEAGDYVAPYRKSVINNSVSLLSGSLMPIYAMYREAQNASSNFYKFICYFKIMDGLMGKMRADVFQMARDASINLEGTKLIVPDHEDIQGDLRQSIGRPVMELFDGLLTTKFRNAASHFMTKDGSILNVSDPEHIDNYAGVILICELCVRLSIADHEAMLQKVALTRS